MIDRIIISLYRFNIISKVLNYPLSRKSIYLVAILSSKLYLPTIVDCGGKHHSDAR